MSRELPSIHKEPLKKRLHHHSRCYGTSAAALIARFALLAPGSMESAVVHSCNALSFMPIVKRMSPPRLYCVASYRLVTLSDSAATALGVSPMFTMRGRTLFLALRKASRFCTL